jgi:metal-responsive CopG/Arc/MetJ family transcriptional regulator
MEEYKMTTISIRLPDNVLHEVDRFSKDLKVPRTEYLRQAILLMNRKVKEDRRRVRIMKLSQRVRTESMRVNAEFSEVEHDPGY